MFPVLIDPTVTPNNAGSDDTYIESGSSADHSAGSELRIGENPVPVSVAPSHWLARLVLPFLRARLTIDESSFSLRMVSRIGRRVVAAGTVTRSDVQVVECGNSIYKSYLKVRGFADNPMPGVGAIWIDDAAVVRTALDSQGWPVTLGASWEHSPFRLGRRR